MANLLELRQLYGEDVDAATMQALRINEATHTPRGYTVGDAAVTGAAPNHLHFETSAGSGYELYHRHAGLGSDKLIGLRPIVYQFMAPFEGPTLASGTMTVNTNPTSGDGTNNDTFRIGAAVYNYRFVTVLSQAFDVLIGATATDTARNLARAINGFPAGSGTDYHAATPAHPNIKAVNWNSSAPLTYTATITFTSRLPGSAGNSIQMIVGSNGTGGGGGYAISGNPLGSGTGTFGGGQHLTPGAAYYTMSGAQLIASRGFKDASKIRRLLAWSYHSISAPTVQGSSTSAANTQLELVYGAGTSLMTLTAGSATTDSYARTQYSDNGGNIDIPANEYVWARVPALTGSPLVGPWACPPGAIWTLYFSRSK